jgi:CheY-like chemotaxis protein
VKTSKPILLLEDDIVDIKTIQRAFKENNIINRLDICNNGEEALRHLRDVNKELPCLILLDLNMPRMNGLEFLSIIKKDEHYKKIPVVILTTSQDHDDKSKSFELGVAGYMVKTVNYDDFSDIIKNINKYWTRSEFPDIVNR